MRFTVIRSLEGMKAAGSAWERFLPQTVFQTFEWHAAWYEHLCPGEIYLVLAEENRRLCAVAPLWLQKKFGLSVLRFAGSPMADYNSFVAESPDAMEQLTEFVMQECSWDVLILDDIMEGSALPKMARKYSRDNLGVFGANPCMSLDLKRAGPGVMRKRGLNRFIKALRKMGKLEFVIARNHAQALDILARQHRDIWRLRGELSMFCSPARYGFLRKIADSMPHNIHIWMLILNSEPIAIQFGFSFRGTYVTYIQSHDPRYKKYSAGTLLYSHFIRHYLEQGYSAVDHTRGTEPYKERFSNTRTENSCIAAAKSGLAWAVLSPFLMARERTLRNPRLHEMTVSARRMLKKPIVNHRYKTAENQEIGQ